MNANSARELRVKAELNSTKKGIFDCGDLSTSCDLFFARSGTGACLNAVIMKLTRRLQTSTKVNPSFLFSDRGIFNMDVLSFQSAIQ